MRHPYNCCTDPMSSPDFPALCDFDIWPIPDKKWLRGASNMLPRSTVVVLKASLGVNPFAMIVGVVP